MDDADSGVKTGAQSICDLVRRSGANKRIIHHQIHSYLDRPAPSLFAALGLTGLRAGAINAPLIAVLLGLELFGITSGPYLLLSCTVAYLFSGHRSAITTQLLQFTKAPALQASTNREIGEVEVMKIMPLTKSQEEGGRN